MTYNPATPIADSAEVTLRLRALQEQSRGFCKIRATEEEKKGLPTNHQCWCHILSGTSQALPCPPKDN